MKHSKRIYTYQLTKTLSRNSASICLFVIFQQDRNKSYLAATLCLSLQCKGSNDEAVLNSHWLRNCSSAGSCCWFKVRGIALSWN